MSEVDDKFKNLIYMSAIPKEMFWAYMAVQQSGIWNMMCVHPIIIIQTQMKC